MFASRETAADRDLFVDGRQFLLCADGHVLGTSELRSRPWSAHVSKRAKRPSITHDGVATRQSRERSGRLFIDSRGLKALVCRVFVVVEVKDWASGGGMEDQTLEPCRHARLKARTPR